MFARASQQGEASKRYVQEAVAGGGGGGIGNHGVIATPTYNHDPIVEQASVRMYLTEVSDTDGYLVSGDRTIVIPPGQAGRYLITVLARFYGEAGLAIKSDFTVTIGGFSVMASSRNDQAHMMWVYQFDHCLCGIFDLNEGDAVEFYIANGNGQDEGEQYENGGRICLQKIA